MTAAADPIAVLLAHLAQTIAALEAGQMRAVWIVPGALAPMERPR